MATSLRLCSFLVLCVFFLFSSEGRTIRQQENGYETDLRNLLNCLFTKKGCEKEAPSHRDNFSGKSVVYLNGIVYTVDKTEEKQWSEYPKEAIIIKDQKIVFVGSIEDAEELIPKESLVYDLQGAVVLPGIHDIHMHPLEAMSRIGGACKLPSLTPPDDDSFTKELSECPKYRIGTEWVLGGGHSVTPMLEYARNGNSPKKLLDKFISDRPAAMLEETSHSAWVNTKALEWAKINSNTSEVPGGVIMRELNGTEPNGILFENAVIDMFELAMDPADNEAIKDFNYDDLLRALGKLAENGITSLCDARLFWNIRHDETWEEACSDGSLTSRAVLGLWAYPNKKDEDQIRTLKELYSETLDSKCSLRKTQIKVYMDGIIESTTAAMKEPYRVNLSLPVISKENVGMNYFDKERLIKYLIELQDLGDGDGFDFHIHAIGDRGIHEALDAIEVAKHYLTEDSRIPRHRLTHLEILNETDVNRFKELGVIADFQVAGDFTLPSEHHFLKQFVGEEKAEFSIPVKTVVDSGAKATFSSDWDVSTVNPFVGIQHAAQRGDQSVSVKTAIEMYTANPAYAMRQEDRVGILRKGMEADLVIIDQDILDIPVDKISSTKVLETVSMGKSIYKDHNNRIEFVSDVDEWYEEYYYYYYRYY